MYVLYTVRRYCVVSPGASRIVPCNVRALWESCVKNERGATAAAANNPLVSRVWGGCNACSSHVRHSVPFSLQTFLYLSLFVLPPK